MQHISEVMPGVMSRLSCIAMLKDGAAMSALDDAIEAIRSHQERWGHVNEPEETAFTLGILGALIELQVNSVEAAVRLGETMKQRKLANPDPDNDDDPTPPAAMAQAA